MIRVGMIAPGGDRISLVDIDPTLASFQEAVGGYIEHVTLAASFGMYVNEEGKLEGLPHNDLASYLLQLSGYADYVAGPAVLVGPPDGEGNDTDLPAEIITVLGTIGFTVVQEAGG